MIVTLYPNQHVSQTLREIADQIDCGEIDCDNLTIATDNYEVFQMGSINDSQAAKDAVFNMTMAIGKMNAYIYSELGADDDKPD